MRGKVVKGSILTRDVSAKAPANIKMKETAIERINAA